MTNETKIKADEIEEKRVEIRHKLRKIELSKRFPTTKYFLGHWDMQQMPSLPVELAELIVLIVETAFQKQLKELDEEFEAL